MATRLEGAPNFRDLGGCEARDGYVVRRGLVFRSGHFANLTDDDLVAFANLGIKTVIDFRPLYEQDMSGHNRLPEGIEYVPIPIGDPAMAPEVKRALIDGDFSSLPDLRDANRRLIREFATQLGEALRLIAAPERLPLAFHCIGGKDRTGMAAALLLTLLGVPWETVKADYMRTNGRMGGAGGVDAFIAKLAAEREWDPISEEDLAGLRKFFVLEEEYIEAAWDEIERVAGSFCGYVHRYLGITDSMIETMRATLLETP
ncbi:MAG: tyrosine-protein phosphatase [Acidimicrobiia bacterium]|nr:tyrosine-protein phosphatase [Acidimicrobiia bacterium]